MVYLAIFILVAGATSSLLLSEIAKTKQEMSRIEQLGRSVVTKPPTSVR